MNNTAKADYYDYGYEDGTFEEYDLTETRRLVWIVGLVTFIAYIVIVCFGVPANVYVLCRLRKFARENKEKYENGAGLGLFAMTTSDLFSLLAIALQHILASLPISASDMVKSLACKTLIFTTHTMTSVSIWSWLLMSTLRYLAVRHPLFHLRVWRAPYRAIALIVLLSALTNVWLLYAVSSGREGCKEQILSIGGSGGEGANRLLHLVDCIWSYCLPAMGILYMDAMVFLYCPQRSIREISILKRNGYTIVDDTTAQSKNKKANRGLWKWVLLTFIDIVLNTPENLFRLIILFDMRVNTQDNYYYSFRMIAQVLYFAQFAFNAVYLCLFVFDKSIRPDVPQPSAHSFALIETRLASTQGYSSIEQLRRNRSPSPINV